MSNERNSPTTSDRFPEGPMPGVANHDEIDDRRDRHGSAHREAERSGELARLAEHEDERDARTSEAPVHQRQVDLSFGIARRVANRQPRKEPELDGLVREREHPRDEGLRGDDRRERGDRHERVEPGTLGAHRIERARPEGEPRSRIMLGDDHRALSEVGEHQARNAHARATRGEWAPARSVPCRRRAPRRPSRTG